MKSKKIPMRMCLGCRQMKPKNELLRIVHTPNGNVVIDKTGKTEGRGAYICKNVECLKSGIKSKAFARAFNTEIDEALLHSIEGELNG